MTTKTLLRRMILVSCVLLILLWVGSAMPNVQAQAPTPSPARIGPTLPIVTEQPRALEDGQTPSQGEAMPTPADSDSLLDNLSSPAVWVAIIGCIGVIGAAFVTGFFGLLASRRKKG